jgi:hypothetical protein
MLWPWCSLNRNLHLTCSKWCHYLQHISISGPYHQQFLRYSNLFIGPWPSSNSSEILSRTTTYPNFMILGWKLLELSCLQTDTQTNRQTDKQTDGEEYYIVAFGNATIIKRDLVLGATLVVTTVPGSLCIPDDIVLVCPTISPVNMWFDPPQIATEANPVVLCPEQAPDSQRKSLRKSKLGNIVKIRYN